MGYNLFIFERRSDIKTSLDVLSYLDHFIEYNEGKDSIPLDACSDVIVAWAKKMFEKFPSVTRESVPSDEIASSPDVSENYLTNYRFGKHGAYCSFPQSVGEQALEYVMSIADEYGVGVYNPMTNAAVFGKGFESLMFRTERGGDSLLRRDDFMSSMYTLESEERGRSNRDSAFITLWFESDGVEGSFIQCTPYYESGGFFKNLFHKDKTKQINGYIFEVEKDGSLYQTLISNKDSLIELIRQWCIERRVPDVSKYEKIMDTI